VSGGAAERLNADLHARVARQTSKTALRPVVCAMDKRKGRSEPFNPRSVLAIGARSEPIISRNLLAKSEFCAGRSAQLARLNAMDATCSQKCALCRSLSATRSQTESFSANSEFEPFAARLEPLIFLDSLASSAF